MGNAITVNLMYNSLPKRNTKGIGNKYKEDSTLSIKTCYYCNKNFKNKTEYNEHLQHCLNGDL